MVLIGCPVGLLVQGSQVPFAERPATGNCDRRSVLALLLEQERLIVSAFGKLAYLKLYMAADGYCRQCDHCIFMRGFMPLPYKGYKDAVVLNYTLPAKRRFIEASYEVL
jgi:hypothetical protein